MIPLETTNTTIAKRIPRTRERCSALKLPMIQEASRSEPPFERRLRPLGEHQTQLLPVRHWSCGECVRDLIVPEGLPSTRTPELTFATVGRENWRRRCWRPAWPREPWDVRLPQRLRLRRAAPVLLRSS